MILSDDGVRHRRTVGGGGFPVRHQVPFQVKPIRDENGLAIDFAIIEGGIRSAATTMSAWTASPAFW